MAHSEWLICEIILNFLRQLRNCFGFYRQSEENKGQEINWGGGGCSKMKPTQIFLNTSLLLFFKFNLFFRIIKICNNYSETV